MSKNRPMSWPGWLGALVLFVIVYLPPGAAALPSVLGSTATYIAGALSDIAVLALTALLAPLAGHRRRTALSLLIPIYG